MREFNIFGPVNPKLHYHVDRQAVKAAMRALIDKGRYFTLNAARQTGKTTLFREVVAELEADTGYFAILLDFETLQGYNRDEFYSWLHHDLISYWQSRHGEADPVLAWLKSSTPVDQKGFGLVLQHLGERLGRRGVLIIDEFDAIGAEHAEPMLAVFRQMYLYRDQPDRHALQSVVLVGVRNIPSLLGGTQSPFNIADQFTIPYFEPEEVAALLAQHTAETGQVFTPEAVAEIVQETEGQPFLVNRLGQMLTQEFVPDRAQAITLAHLHRAIAELLTENNTHFFSIVSKATPHRAELLPILFYDHRRRNFLDPVTQELIMYGILRVVVDEHSQFKVARPANPIYRKMLIQRFAPPSSVMQVNGYAVSRHVVEGTLDFDGLMDGFKAFMEEHGVRLLRSEATGRPLEISGQYLLLSYLTAALDSLGGQVTIESLTSAGEMDILAFFRAQRFVVETKIWRGPAEFEQGKAQLVKYLTAAGMPKGYLVVFDYRLETNPLAAERGQVFEVTADGKTLRVYLIAVEV